ncbi:MAG: DoxX family protein [Saprospiraceae bacterium]|nr:DoxX family protein [Saprospiraceae bacterium]
MKKTKILFWVTTSFLFLTQGIMPILTIHAEDTKNAMNQLGYPTYFGIMLAVFKFFGGFVLMIPKIPSRIKEWAYAGFTFDFIAALVSIIVVYGIGTTTLIPIIAIAILTLSYVSYHKLNPTV